MLVRALTDEPALRARADDGVALALYRAAPARPRPAPPVLLVHGTFSNRTFFLGARERGLGRWLAERGYDAWVPELRGHGRSGDAGRQKRWNFEDWIRRDAPALVRAVCEATGRDRVIWLGHSAGGVIGFAFGALRDQAGSGGAIAGLIAAGAPAPTGLGVMQYPMAAAGLAVTRLLDRFPARLLGIGPEDEHPGIFAQWMRWNLRGRWLGADGTDYYALTRRVTAPVLGLAGGGDWLIAPPALCEDLVQATGSADRTFLRCGRAEGFVEDYNHHRVIASSSARREIWPLIGDWIEARFG
jgi:oxygen-independent coproporphyrinogen-3 oxidase